MPFYLSEYTGAGTRQDPFRPVGSDQPGWSAIDLRPNPGVLDGGGLNACFLWTPSAFSDARARLLASDKLESLSNQQKNFLTNKLGVNLSSPSLLRDIVATVLNSPPANGWKPLLPGKLRWEIWLGGLLWEAPRASGGASDTFTRADENPIAAPWTFTSAASFTAAQLSSNAIAPNGDSFDYYAGAATTGDHYSQITMNNLGSVDSGGPACRMQSSGANFYHFDEFGTDGVFKFVSGSPSTVGAISGAKSNPVKITANGSSIGIYFNSVQDAASPFTDTSHTGGQPGVFIYLGTMDDWSGGDLEAATINFRPDQTRFPKPVPTNLRSVLRG